MSARTAVVVVSLVLTVGLQAFGQRKPGEYSVYGVGTGSCGEWVESIKDERSMFIKSAWVQGFVTATGRYGRLMRVTDAAAMRGFVTQYCTQHPLETVEEAAANLVNTLQQPR